ncbi:MAG: glycoside hydrolase family 25 protein [Oscillospiraceae bacterium]|nr:glycoside hydrolase family 25 protein [Oscillospiraceae bacterium]
MAYKILDVSKYQPVIDYAACAKDIDGVILRCGLTYWGAQSMEADPSFEMHYKGFKAKGVPVGAYYYSAADSVKTAQKEAAFCLSLLKGKQFELPIYYDVENTQRQGTLGKAAITAITDTFCSTLEKAGYFAGYYSYTAWLLKKFDTAYLSKYTLWKADYRTKYDTTIPCAMHQYTSSGTVAGIDGKVDLSTCTKNFPPLIKGLGLNGYSAYVQPSPPNSVPAAPLYNLTVGPVSTGDCAALKALAQRLQVPAQVALCQSGA